MRNLYWIDSFEGYPEMMDGPIKASIDTYNTVYSSYAQVLGYKFRLVRLEDLCIAHGGEPVVQHAEFGNILAEEAAAYVGLIHPDVQKERKLASLYLLLAASANVRLLNHADRFPMVCKDKFRGVGIARDLGLRVLPTVLLGAVGSGPSQLDFVERTLGRYPMFIRPADLTSGLGKKTVNDRAALQKYLDRPPFPGRTHIVQPCVPVEAEYRVYLDGREIVACRKREPLADGRSCATPDPIREGSRALAAYLGTTYLCVDWLWDGSGFWFCEFETGGGFDELAAADHSRVVAAFFRKLAK